MHHRSLPLVSLLALLLSPPLAAQAIAVTVNRNFHPTAVLLPHVRYIIASDSSDASLVIDELSVPPVTFTGFIRIEGVQPGARAPEQHAFPDTVRFEPDGRVMLLVADAAGRPPMRIEVDGARGATGGRISITAPRWPVGRAMLVTVSPADLYELGHGTGFGSRDRLRVDDRGGFAYLTDSTTGPTTVAIGFGRGTRGRIQGDAASILIQRDYGGETGRLRRQLGALTMVVDPARDDDGTARADIVFGIGNSEAEASHSAQAAADEPQITPRPAPLRWHTPSADADLLVRQLTTVAGWMLDWDLVGGQRTIPSSATHPAVRAVDAWAGAPLALQRGDTAAVCGSYRLLRGAGTDPTRDEVALRLGPQGRVFTRSDTTSPASDAALVLLGWSCYLTTRNAAMLRADYPKLAAAATRASTSDAGVLGPEAVERLAELADEMARLGGGPSSGDSLRGEAARLASTQAAPLPGSLWRGVFSQSQSGVNREYGRLSDGGPIGGTSLAAGGALVDQVAGELFGINEYVDHLEIAPQLAGIADDQAWSIDGWLLADGDTLGMSYRPADRAATIRLSAAPRRRFVVRFPWMTPSGCVSIRRGNDTERPLVTQQSDGSLYFDVRGTFDPAVITVSASACGS